ncbi:MAG TPA: hypothetical protein VNJ53_06435 [Gaiellaceae bacterium]|nr:hypothetical protein [Gaiellaceae bacterium]
MTLLAAIRPESWNLPLFLHVLGAMLVAGGLLASVSLLASARRDPDLARLGYRTLAIVGVPSYALMWGAGHWTYSREGLDESAIESAWVAIGFAVTEVGVVLLVAALVLAGLAQRRLRAGRSTRLLTVAAGLLLVLLVALGAAAWAMAAKPG